MTEPTDHRAAAAELLDRYGPTDPTSTALMAIAHALLALDSLPWKPAPPAPPARPNPIADPYREALWRGAPSSCGCSLFARCQMHEAGRPKGCGCNGPYASSMCANSTHQQLAAQWPDLDPARVG